MQYKLKIIIYTLFFTLVFAIEEKTEGAEPSSGGNRFGSFGLVGQYGTLPNPMNDRAKGYLLKGRAQTAITNYGNFINWDHHPAGLWGEYTYLPTTAFMAGVPGHSYTYKYNWFN